MEFKQYPSYKNSGVEWLGDVPEHWDLKRFKYILEELNELSELGDETLLSVSEYYGVKPRKETIDEGDILSRAESLSGYKKCKSGDLVMNIMLAWKRGLGITKFDGIVSPAYAVFRLFSHNYSEDYIHYLLRTDTYTNYFKSFSTGVMDSRLRLYPEYFGNLTNISPSLKEQNQIVSFLNTETTRIDNLISKQEKLIELLEEQRKSIISHAVTKGLNPNAPMKDSGVEWLGEVPEHWDVKSYRFVSKIYRGKFGHRPRNDPSLYDGEYPFIQTGDVARAGKYIQTYSQTLNEKGKAVSQVFTSGTLVMAIAANIGDTAILNFEAYAPDSVVGFKPHKNIDLEFLRFSFIASLQALEQTAVQSTQANLNVERIGALKTTFPPLSEQIEISNYLNAENEKNNHLISKQNQLIEKLKEYRASIISHAVTGKIDVREFGA